MPPTVVAEPERRATQIGAEVHHQIARRPVLPRLTVARRAGSVLASEQAGPTSFERAAGETADEVAVHTDRRASAEYRRQLVTVYVPRCSAGRWIERARSRMQRVCIEING